MNQLDDLQLINLINENIDLFGDEIKNYIQKSFSTITADSTSDDARRALRKFPLVFTEGKKVDKDFLDLVKQLRKSEELLTTISDFYRDHYFHQVRVTLLGLYILRKGNLIKLIESLNPKLFEEIGGEENCEFAWLYASLFHDIGYPIAKIHEIKNFVRDIIRSFPDFHFDIVSELQFDFDPINTLKDIANFGDSQNNRASFLRESLITHYQKDHGIISSLIVFNNFKKKYRERFLLAGLQGMAMHNLSKEKLGFEIKFEDFPFAYLLVLCDEIQEWGRLTRAGLTSHRIVPFESIGFELNNNEKQGIHIKVLLRCDCYRMDEFDQLAREEEDKDYLDWDEYEIFHKKYQSLQKLGVCKDINIEFVLKDRTFEKSKIFTENGKWNYVS